MYQPRSMRPTGPGTPYTGFGDERRAPRTQDQIREYLAEGEAIAAKAAAEARTQRVEAIAPAFGALVMANLEQPGAGTVAEQTTAAGGVEAMAQVAIRGEVA